MTKMSDSWSLPTMLARELFSQIYFWARRRNLQPSGWWQACPISTRKGLPLGVDCGCYWGEWNPVRVSLLLAQTSSQGLFILFTGLHPSQSTPPHVKAFLNMWGNMHMLGTIILNILLFVIVIIEGKTTHCHCIWEQILCEFSGASVRILWL